MMKKSTIRFFVSDFAIVTIGIIHGMLYRLIMILKGIKQTTIKEDKIIIIGNGPSFKQTIENSLNILQTNPCMVVNGFATSPMFESIKPKYYILADPVYFTPYDKLSERNKIVVGDLLNALLNKIDWDITFIFPITGKDSELHIKLKALKTASFIFYNNKGNGVAMPDCNLKYWLWNNNLLAPLCQTVMNTAVSTAITSQVKNIYVVGADTSWLSLLEVDQETNDLFTKDTHFYDVKKFIIYSDELAKTKQYIHDELNCIKAAFKSYYTLSEYAKYNKVNLINASEYSWVDSLKRGKLEELN